MGTVSYMSPEQARGAPVDARSDLFSFGVVLYEMATGVLPHRGNSTTEIIDAILNRQPVPPVRLNPHIPDGLERVITRALEKDPALRYQGAAEMKSELKRLLRNSGSMPAAAPILERRRFLLPRHAIAVGISVLMLIVAAVLWVRRIPAPSSAPDGPIRIAVLPFENQGTAEDAYFADGMTDEVRNKLASLPELVVISRNSMTGYKGTQKTPQVIAKELSIHYLLSGTVRWQKGTAGASRIRVAPELAEITAAGVPEVRWQDSFDAVVEDVFTVQSEIASRVAGALKVKLGAQEQRQLAARPTTNLAAYDAFLRAEAIWHESGNDAKTLESAIAQFEQAVKLDPVFALAWARLSFLRSTFFYNVKHDAEIAQSARAAGERSLQLSPGLAAGRLAMSWYFSSVEKDNNRALEQCSEALAADRNNVDLLMGAALAEMGLGRWNEALAHADKARFLDPRSVPAIYRNGVILVWLRRYAAAISVFEQALAVAPANLAALQMKAMAFLGEGNLTAAQALLKQPGTPHTELLINFGMYWDLYWLFDDAQREALLKLSLENFAGVRASRAITFAQVCAGAGRTAELRKFSEEAERAFAADLATTPEEAEMHVMRGLALAYLGRKNEAVREGERGLALLPVSRDGYTGPYVQHQLVRIYMIVGEKEKALDLLEPLFKVPYYLSPAWLSIDPNFAPLKGHPRFEALLHKNM